MGLLSKEKEMEKVSYTYISGDVCSELDVREYKGLEVEVSCV